MRHLDFYGIKPETALVRHEAYGKCLFIAHYPERGVVLLPISGAGLKKLSDTTGMPPGDYLETNLDRLTLVGVAELSFFKNPEAIKLEEEMENSCRAAYERLDAFIDKRCRAIDFEWRIQWGVIMEKFALFNYERERRAPRRVVTTKDISDLLLYCLPGIGDCIIVPSYTSYNIEVNIIIGDFVLRNPFMKKEFIAYSKRLLENFMPTITTRPVVFLYLNRQGQVLC